MPADSLLLTLEQLRRRKGEKWGPHPSNVIPASIAEMDFQPAKAIVSAVQSYANAGDFGYPARDGRRSPLPRLFAERAQRMHDWRVDPDRIEVVTNLDQAILACVLAFSKVGDGVVVIPPIYPPMRDAVLQTGRTLVECPLRQDGDTLAIDHERLDQVCPRASLLLICNPHNPTGIAFRREALAEMARIVARHDLVVVSDEIYADLVLPPRRHVPLAAASPSVRSRCVTLASAVKAFNMPGLRCGLICFGSEPLHHRFGDVVPAGLLGLPAAPSLDAVEAAWHESQHWLDEVLTLLDQLRGRLLGYAAAHFGDAKIIRPDAAFLAWIDFSGCELPSSPEQFFLETAQVALSPGHRFGKAYAQCARLNFGTSPEIPQIILERMGDALARHEVVSGPRRADANPVSAAVPNEEPSL